MPDREPHSALTARQARCGGRSGWKAEKVGVRSCWRLGGSTSPAEGALRVFFVPIQPSSKSSPRMTWANRAMRPRPFRTVKSFSAPTHISTASARNDSLHAHPAKLPWPQFWDRLTGSDVRKAMEQTQIARELDGGQVGRRFGRDFWRGVSALTDAPGTLEL